MRTIMLASALACALAPVAPVAASAAAGDSMKTRGTYQTHSLRCLVSGRGQTNSIVVFNQAIGRVPKGAVIELRVRTARGPGTCRGRP